LVMQQSRPPSKEDLTLANVWSQLTPGKAFIQDRNQSHLCFTKEEDVICKEYVQNTCCLASPKEFELWLS